MSIKEHKWEVIIGILLEMVIDHNFIPASELSPIPSPLIRLYLLIPRIFVSKYEICYDEIFSKLMHYQQITIF